MLKIKTFILNVQLLTKLLELIKFNRFSARFGKYFIINPNSTLSDINVKTVKKAFEF